MPDGNPIPDPAVAERQWLAEQRRLYGRLRAAAAARETGWSWTRLGCFLIAVAVWFAASTAPWAATGVTAACAITFACAVHRHGRARLDREQCDRLLVMAEESQARLDTAVVCIRGWQRPPDDAATDAALPLLRASGESWALSDQERDDLDLYAAPVGLFGLLNRTSTSLGARRLRDWLDHPCLESDEIRARQAAARWLAEHPATRLYVMAAAASLRREDARLARLIAALHQAKPLSLGLPKSWLLGWSIVSLAATLALAGLALSQNVTWAALLALLLLINAAQYYSFRHKLTDALRPWRDVAWAARGAAITARCASRELPDDGPLADLRSKFAAVASGDALGRLSRRVGWSEGGGLVHQLFNLVAFFDLHVAESILRIALPRRDALLAALAALRDFEAFASLACFAWEQPLRCWPVPCADVEVRIDAGVHPLVPPQRVVANDVALSAAMRMLVVTGSNMAGKSTYLRMVGINVLLAQIGCVATARAMRACPVRLLSDLRARDSLAADESYFLSEVRHLRRMVCPPDGEAPILGLIDEPFRGTNSQDQTAASVAVMRHLMASPHLFVLATHDRHLTEVADGRVARNVHFQENLGRDGLVFDYRVHDGPATSRNALRILAREGYPQTLLRDAHDWLAGTAPAPNGTPPPAPASRND